jgi:MYXO-CTERM domain-containing protein
MSGKMGGERKMSAAKKALKTVLNTVSDTTHVGLLVFSASNVKDDWIYPLGPIHKAKLMAAIDRPEPYGGTPLGGYIKQGADRLLQARKAQFGYGTYRLLVVTDGEASDRAVMEKYAPDVMARGISLDVIGVGMSATHSLAKMAHSYRKADDAASLARAVAEVFAEVSAKDTQASGGEDAFAAIDPLPIEVAGAMIKALTDSGNHPIGGRPPAPKPPAPLPSQKTPAKTPTQPLSGAQPPPDSGCGCRAGDDAGGAPWGGLALALLVGLRRRRR